MHDNWNAAAALVSARRHSNAPALIQAAATNGDIAPILLTRARSIAKQHETLSDELATNFDAITARHLGRLSRTANALGQFTSARSALTELQTLLSDPKTDPEIRSLGEEDLEPATVTLADATSALKRSLIPEHPFAHLPCLLEIRPGAGGSEAALFANDMLRMYMALCARHGLACTILKREDADGPTSGSEAPLQEAVLEINTPGAYGRLRCEAGVHRVQRVPATESKGRTHTSAVSVLVLPKLEGNEEDIDGDELFAIDPKDVRTDIMRARGAGGQHVNTTNSAVRLTHIPTNTVVAIQDARSQPKNKEKAWALLRARLAQQRREAKEEEMLRMRRNVIGLAKMGRGDKIRTYNWSQQRVTDHRSGLTVHDLDGVLAGGETVDRIMDSVRDWLDEQEVLGLMADEDS